MFRTTTSKTASAGPPLTRRAIRPFSLACTALLSALGTDGAIADLAWNQPTVVVYNTPHQTVHIDQQITSGTLTVTLAGSAGGYAVDGLDHSQGEHGQGGLGARMSVGFRIGTGVGEIPPGSALHCWTGIPGQPSVEPVGWTQRWSAAGGGGGAGIVLEAPGEPPVLLAVAGGGGGGFAKIADDIGRNGSPGNTEPDGRQGGGNGGSGGTAGLGGENRSKSGGGGGAYGDGHAHAFAPDSGGKAWTNGGYGGIGDVGGGLGIGGGGAVDDDEGGSGFQPYAGAGGGGYSGGGAGSGDHGGGGGGSWADPAYAVWGPVFHETGLTGGTFDNPGVNDPLGYVAIGLGGETCDEPRPLGETPHHHFLGVGLADASGDCATSGAPDTWFSVANPYDCDVTMTVHVDGGNDFPGAVSVWADCNTMLECAEFGLDGGVAISWTMGASATHLVRVAAERLAYDDPLHHHLVESEFHIHIDPPDFDDEDGDQIPDGCDACFGGNDAGDADLDGICDDVDPYPFFFGGAELPDTDGDGTPDDYDNCPGLPNDQFDSELGALAETAIGVWRFDDDLIDEVAHDYVGTNHAQLVDQVHRDGPARHRDGLSMGNAPQAFIPFDDAFAFGTDDDFTVSVWVRFAPFVAGSAGIVESGLGGMSPFRIRCAYHPNPYDPARPQVEIIGVQKDALNVTRLTYMMEAPSPELPTHVAFLRRDGQFELYVAGQLVDSGPDETPLGIFSTQSIWLGSTGGTSRFFEDGMIDELAIFDYGLQPLQVLGLAVVGLGDGMGDACDPLPDHDSICDRGLLDLGTQTPFTNDNATSFGPDLPSGCDDGDGVRVRADIWYDVAFQDGTPGQLRVWVTDSTFSARLALYDRLECPDMGPDVALLACSGAGEVLEFDYVPDGPDLQPTLRIGSADGSTGTGMVHVEFVPTCSADLDASGEIDTADLLMLIGAWGACDGACPADLNGDGVVDTADMLALIGSWGPC